MLVQDDMGEWSVFELSPHGHTCTPYRDRIYQSHSTSIVLFPVESTAYLGDSIRYRQRIYREVQSALAADQQPYEPLEILKGCGTKLFFENQATWNYAAADANSAQQGSREYPYSPSLQIIIKILQHSTDVTFEHQPEIDTTGENNTRRLLQWTSEHHKQACDCCCCCCLPCHGQ